MSFFRTTRARTLRSNICGSQCDKPCYSRRFIRLGYNKPRIQYSPIPYPPASFEGDPGNNTVTLFWSEPVYKGNFEISYYTVKNITLDISTKIDGLTTTFTGLTNQPYTFTITATNSEDYTSTTYQTVTITPFDVPGAPTNVTGTRGNGEVTVSWTAPSSTGGTDITEYTVTSSPGGFTAISTTTTAIVTGLINGTSYTFTVIATNSVGNSPASVASSSITPATYPDAPTGLSVSRGNGTATISFSAPSDNGGNTITNYLYSTNGTIYTYANTTSSPITISNLTNANLYTIYLKSVNEVGTSESYGSVTIDPVTVPGQPSISATKGDSSATISFSAPSNNGGNAITSYKYKVDTGDYELLTSTMINQNSFTINDLINGTEYTIYLKATNDIGDSEPGSTTVTPGDVPVAPSIDLVPSDGEITLYINTDYALLENNRGSSITSYEYSIDDGERYIPTTQTTTTIDRLENGNTYTVMVRAVNANGTSQTTTSTSTPFATV